MSLLPVLPPPLALATMRSIADEKTLGLGQGRAERGPVPDRESALRRVIQPQFAPTPWAPVLRLPPVAGLRSRSASGPKQDPSKPDRTLHAPQPHREAHRPERLRGTPAELALHRNTS